jgi:hypothetical protein
MMASPHDVAIEENSSSNESTHDQSPSISWKNLLNLVAYLVNSTVTYSSLTGIWGATNTELSKKYQTLLTPSGWAFAIWGPIFIWEGVFAVTQMLPAFRSLASVQSVAPWWWAACAVQVSWSFVFAQDIVTGATLLMLSILICLVGLVVFGDRKRGSTAEYWLIRAPFALQLGWIIVASELSLNVQADSMKASPATLLMLAILSLVFLLCLVTVATIAAPLPNPIVCFVGFWACMGIYAELGNAENLLNTSKYNPIAWDPYVLNAIRGAALTVGLVSLASLALAAVLRLRAPSGCSTCSAKEAPTNFNVEIEIPGRSSKTNSC